MQIQTQSVLKGLGRGSPGSGQGEAETRNVGGKMIRSSINYKKQTKRGFYIPLQSREGGSKGDILWCSSGTIKQQEEEKKKR